MSRSTKSPFLVAISWVTATCTLVGLSGFTINVVVRSNQEPRIFDAVIRQRMYISFDAFMWLWIALAMSVPHIQVKYRRLWHFWQLRACYAVAVSWVLFGHSFWLAFPTRGEMEVVTNFAAFLLINVVPLVVSKWLVYQESVSKSPAAAAPPSSPSKMDPIPRQQMHSTLMFPGIIIALTSYGVSFTMTDPIVKASCLILVLFTGAVVCVTALKYRTRLKLHFDYVLVLWCAYFAAPVARRALLVLLDTDGGKKFPIILIYGYRGLISAFILLFDELMEATFGQGPQSLWGTFFMRIFESLVSLSMALNTVHSISGVVTYVGTNVAVTILKDGGLQDDLRFLISNGYSVWFPNRRRCHVAAMRTTRSAFSSRINSSRQPPPSTTAPVASIPTDRLAALSTDLAIQIERSELTLISRVSSFTCVSACFCLTQVWKRTSTSSQLALLETDEDKQAAYLLLLMTLADLILSRAVAAAIMKHKIELFNRFLGVDSTPIQAALPEPPLQADSYLLKPPTIDNAQTMPMRSSSLAASFMMPECPSAASMQRMFPESIPEAVQRPLRRHVLWETGLPQPKSFKKLVFALITFSTLVHLGAW